MKAYPFPFRSVDTISVLMKVNLVILLLGSALSNL
nr:MAG TPA: hypothetical protein [Caudoviricetes sp.]